MKDQPWFCRDCRFFDESGFDNDDLDPDEIEEGHCMRLPPRPHADGDYDQGYPKAYGNKWCGEYFPIHETKDDIDPGRVPKVKEESNDNDLQGC